MKMHKITIRSVIVWTMALTLVFSSAMPVFGETHLESNYDEEELEELDFYEYKDAHEYLTRQCEHVQVLLEMIARELV